MNTIGFIKKKIGVLIAILAGFAVGSLYIFGFYPAAAAAVFLFSAAVICIFKRSYHAILLIGILMLSCVFVEPSPSDYIFGALFPLGLLTGKWKPGIRGKAAYSLLFMLVFFIISLPGVARSADQSESIRYFMITFYLFMFSFFILSYADNDNIKDLLRAYVLAALISFTAALAGFLGVQKDLLMADRFRVRGLFKDPNVFGPFFVPGILILLNDFKQKKVFKIHGIFHIIMILCMSLGVLFSFSRGAWVNLGVSLFIYAILNIKTLSASVKGQFAAVALLLGISCLIAAPYFTKTELWAFLQERARFQDYDAMRFKTHQIGLELITQNPLGLGSGQFEYELQQLTGYSLSAHSLYIRTAAEHGIPGFLCLMAAFLIMIAQLLRAHFLKRKTDKEIRGTTGNKLYLAPAVPISVFSGLLVNSLVVDTIHWRHLWFFFGVGLFCLKQTEEAP